MYVYIFEKENMLIFRNAAIIPIHKNESSRQMFFKCVHKKDLTTEILLFPWVTFFQQLTMHSLRNIFFIITN